MKEHKLRHKKTGTIVNLAKKGLLKSDNDGNIVIYIDRSSRYYKYDSLEAVYKDWEDYEPVEPLIKDNEIRKIVRDWAKLYDNKAIRTYKRGEYVSLYKDEVNGYSLSVGIDLPNEALGTFIDDHYYNIVELCGEK